MYGAEIFGTDGNGVEMSEENKVIESLNNAWRALTRQYDEYPDESTRRALNLLNKIIERIKTELRNPNEWKQITIEEWIKMLKGGEQ